MRRRELLRAGVPLAAGALAGCSGLVETRRVRSAPPVLDNRPDGVYYPTHVEGMKMTGMAASGDYKFALMYSYPHRFWTVTGSEASKVSIQSDDEVHLMATVWDPRTRTVLPETGLSVEITKGNELVSHEVIYPMLSQPMGFHHGGNFDLDGDGTYTVTVSVGRVTTRRTGAFRDRFAEPASADVEFEYSRAARNEIMYRILDEKAGEPGALDPMEMPMPSSLAPTAEELPGTVLGEATSDDAVLVVTALDEPPVGVEGADGADGSAASSAAGESGTYLAVSARTPYNRMILPAMALSGTLTRDGETVFEGQFTPTLDPDLDYHYGAVVQSGEAGGGGETVQSGDELELRFGTPPQVARHEGYETAFLDMTPTSISVS